MFANDHVRNHIIGFGPVNDIARPRIQAGDQRQDIPQLVFFQAAAAQQLGVIAVAQQVDVMGNYKACLGQPGCFRRQLVELDQQAFL